jgi:CDP-glucose 4,6-dehydratase
MNPMFDFYKGRRVLVTGHTGFKGAWLSHWLDQLGATVCGISLPPDTEPSIFTLTAGAERRESHLFDIADLDAVKKTVTAFAPEIIFHLAAQSLVRRSYAFPSATFQTNVMGTLNVLDAARAAPSLKAIVVVTSDKVYRNLETGRAFVEDDPLGGDDPYSASKACTEIASQSWRASFLRQPGAPRLATVRAGNVFGGGDWCADRLLPDIVRAVSAGEPVILRNPAAVRPWQYVLEALCGYLTVGQRLAAGEDGADEAWNFGPIDDEVIDVAAFAQRTVAAWGRGSVELRPDPGAPKEARLLRLDSSKSVARLGWKPALSFQESLEWSVGWYSQVLADPGKAHSVTAAQLRAFMQRS